MDLLDEFELTCVIAALEDEEKRTERRYWVHPMNEQRLSNGEFQRLYYRLREHPARFFNYYRMTVTSFDELLNLLSETSLQETTTRLRVPIQPEERLTVTLGYLITGTSFSAMQHQFLMGKSTICAIVKETCDLIWLILKESEMPIPDEEKWAEIAEGFRSTANFPNCAGAVDGKHIRIMCPDKSGSSFFCYKKFFSLVLMAVVDANYCFTFIDVGSYGREGDSYIFKESRLGQLLYNDQLNLPGDKQLPNSSEGSKLPFVFIGDEAFASHRNLLKPYAINSLDLIKRIFNYRLSRGRRYVECTFGILCKKFEIFYGCIKLQPNSVMKIVKAATVLHNFIRRRDGFVHEHILLCEMASIEQHHSTRSRSLQATNVRDKFAEYFVSQEGAIPWQNSAIGLSRTVMKNYDNATSEHYRKNNIHVLLF